MREEWALWGFLPGRIKPLKLTIGSLRSCDAEYKRRTGQGWVCGTYRLGVKPEGLLAQFDEQAKW